MVTNVRMGRSPRVAHKGFIISDSSSRRWFFLFLLSLSSNRRLGSSGFLFAHEHYQPQSEDWKTRREESGRREKRKKKMMVSEGDTVVGTSSKATGRTFIMISKRFSRNNRVTPSYTLDLFVTGTLVEDQSTYSLVYNL